MSTTISRLQAANPIPARPDRADTLVARETLERIVGEPRPATRPPRAWLRGRLPRGGIAIAVALGLAGGGAAFAATNPFGWWSSNPNQAKYELNPATHARTPAAYTIGCHGLRCVANGRGQLYTKIDTIQSLGPSDVWSRGNLLKATQKALAEHRLTAAQAAKIRHDLAHVPDSFFSEMRAAMRYATVGGGSTTRVPPPGVPEFLVCEQVAGALSCQNLNGDERTPIGAGVYTAQPASDWRAAPPQRPDYGLPPGIHFTRAEYQVLIDLTFGMSTSGGGSRVQRVPARHS